jgi:hypothetical protein
MNVKSKYVDNKTNHSKIKINKKLSKSSNIPKTIIIQSPMGEKINSKMSVHYPITNIVETDFKKIPDTIENIITCIYRINTTKNNYATSLPYLEYLLYKYPSEKKHSIENTCIFPFVKYSKNKTILSQSNDLCHKITNTKIKNKGFLVKNNNVYVFYEFSLKYYENIAIKYLDSKIELWWTLIDEICNHKKILTFPIHKSVYELFYNNPILIYLRDDSSKQLEIPQVAFCGGYKNTLTSIVLAINTLQKTFYHKVFGSFNYAIRQAGWSNDFKKIILNGKDITDKNGKYISGGIVRFALFTKNTTSIINNGNNLSEFKKKTDLWKMNHDSISIGIIKNKNNKTFFSTNPYYQIKSFSQKTPLSVHLLDMNTLKKWDPFSTTYRIE